MMYVIGVFPPPHTGKSFVTFEFTKALESYHVTCSLIDISPVKNGESSWAVKLVRVFKGCFKLIFTRATSSQSWAYIALSSGPSLVLELLYVTIGRLKGIQIICHHHSCAYTAKSNFVVKLLASVCGENAIHIVQSNLFRSALSAMYGVKNIYVISNSFFMPAIEEVRYRNKITKIGYLSNVSFGKGIREFVDLAQFFERRFGDIKWIIAGPFADLEVEIYVRNALGQSKNLEYLGPLYEKSKDEFFSSIDLFVFPTHLEEAEAIVNLEAMRSAVPVISSNKGSIPEYLTNDVGVCVKECNHFVAIARKEIESLIYEPSKLFSLSRGASQKYRKMNTSSQDNFRQLLGCINIDKEA